MKTANSILLVRVPAEETVVGRELRDYILESLACGVLALTEDATCEVMELPTLGGVGDGPPRPMADWRKISGALDALEKSEDGGVSPERRPE